MRACTVPGCETKHFANGYCRKHDTRVKRNGTTDSLYDKSGYSKLGGVKDIGIGRRGSLAVNWINDIKYKAKKRGKEWNLTHEEAFILITSSCVYCGFTPNFPENRVGIDRVHNDTGYQNDNCVPCCFTCNSAKGVMSYDDFKAWIKQVYEYTFLG